jgi:hypothetical protein
VPSNTELPPQSRQHFPLRSDAPANEFTLRDLYVRASISGNSMAAELGRYLNINESTFSNSPKEISDSNDALVTPTVHEQALSAILEVVTTTPNATSQYVRIPTPQGGVQDWWARMISGSFNNASSTTSCPSIGESL